MLIPSLKNTAPNNIALSICEYVRKNGVDIDLFYLDDDHLECEFSKDICVYKLENRRDLNNYDIIHSHGIRPDFINLFSNKNVIKITTIHSFIIYDLRNRYGLKGWLIARFWIFFLKKFTLCISISKATEIFYKRYGLKCHHIYNGVNIDKYKKNNIRNQKKSNENISVVTIASLEKIKGIEQLLYLVAEKKNIQVHVIGEGSYRVKLMDLINKFSISDRVILHGYLEHPSQLLDKFDVYVQPSLSEGFGMAVIEALLSKIPTVCSDIEVFNELFGNGEVEFFKLNDVESLYKAILSSINKSSEIIDEISDSIKDRFSSETMSLNYMKWYNEIYEGKNI